MERATRKTQPSARRRNPVETRSRLLGAAFREMHRSGFRGTDLDTILSQAGVTKGAMYHHFGGKQAIGYAVVDEVIGDMTRERWVEPLARAEDPIAALKAIFSGASADFADFDRGCPLQNLSLEMSALDEGFRTRTAQLFRVWRGAIVEALRRGQAQGQVAEGLDLEEEAEFLIAAYEGYIQLAKNARDSAPLKAAERRLVRHIESLRP
jgi:TetR/AcrR family transcriptional regulator, transcriptional repressor for nem operon